MTIVSMTGFAEAHGARGSLRWRWEIKSVNGRGLELRLRTPPGFDGIEAQIFGIGAHETDRIGPARQRVEPVLLQRFQMILANLQRLGGGGQIVAASQPGGPEVLADGIERRIRLARNLAQMDALAAEAAAFVEGQMSHFGHCRYEYRLVRGASSQTTSGGSLFFGPIRDFHGRDLFGARRTGVPPGTWAV